MTLFDIAKEYKDKSQLTLNVLLQVNKFKNILKEYKYELIEHVELSYNELEHKFDSICVNQITIENDIIITWQEIETKEEIYINVIQFNYLYKFKNIIEKIKDDILSIHIIEDNKEENNTFNIINFQNNEIYMTKENVEYIDNDIELNYGKDFVKINNNIIKGLLSDKSGIIILSGDEGTGKTQYVKYIISKISDKKNIIFIPRHLLHMLADSEFISFIKDQTESILILEDADEILSNRDEILSSSIINNILGITNGILNNTLKIKIFITFSIDRKYIDKKFLKSHRIIEDYHFKLLTAEQANTLANKLKIEQKYIKNISLSEIYEDLLSNDIGIKKKRVNKKRVGFKEDEDK